MRRAAVCSVLLLLLPANAAAHARPLSYSSWSLGERVEVDLQLTCTDLAVLGLPAEASEADFERVGKLLQTYVSLHDDSGVCAPLEPPRRLPATRPWTVWQWTLSCARPGPRTVDLGLLAKLEPGHRHLARVQLPGQPAIDRVLSMTAPRWSIEARDQRGSSIADYVSLGIEHLWTGPDHVLFVFALLLLAARLREVILFVSSFTLAHSATLALTVLGWVKPRAAPVEVLIAFSVALLGAENVWLLAGRGRVLPALVVAATLGAACLGFGPVPSSAWLALAVFCACHFSLLRSTAQPAGARAVISCAFGLVHGFGFASVVSELDLPWAQLGRALLGFNLGVELGQLGIVLACWPLLRAPWLLQRPLAADAMREIASAGICGTGVYWLIQRML